MPLFLIETHGEESDDDGDPIEIVRKNGAVGRRVLPPEQGVEDSPSSTAVDLGIAALMFWSVTAVHQGSYFRGLVY